MVYPLSQGNFHIPQIKISSRSLAVQLITATHQKYRSTENQIHNTIVVLKIFLILS